MPDYFVLLKKYIKHVGYVEGVDFVTSLSDYRSEWFSESEWEMLKRIANQVWEEDRQ